MSYIVCYGNPIDGFDFVGPFESAEEAVEYGNSERFSTNWWVAKLYEPAA